MEHKTPKKKILVHNAANPFVTDREISAVLEKISPNTCVGVGRKITNTLRTWEKNSPQKKFQPIDREKTYAMETPQGAFLEDFLQWIGNNEALQISNDQLEGQKRRQEEYQEITDEMMLAELHSGKIEIIPASDTNRKITIPSDIPVEKSHGSSLQEKKFPITGFGIDSHRLESRNIKNNEQKSCILCGIEIKNSPAFIGNSDSDVALHALSNALLSTLGGNSFSTIADPLYKAGEKNSEIYLRKILKIFYAEEKKILHLVLSFEGLRPKIEKYFPDFRKNLSRILEIPEKNIGLNATTGEGLDGYGRGEGMKVSAVVTVR